MPKSFAAARSAMKRLLGVVAVTLAAIGTFEPVGEAGELSTLACYVALAYDVAPLADPSLPDTGRES